jgi:hypothetical protein
MVETSHELWDSYDRAPFLVHVQVVVYDVAAQEQLWSSQPGHTETIFDCSFAPGPSTSLLATCSFDSTVRVWDAATNTCVKTLDTNAIARDAVVHVKGLSGQVLQPHRKGFACLCGLHHAGHLCIIRRFEMATAIHLTTSCLCRVCVKQVFQATHCILWPGALTAASWQRPVQEARCTSLTTPRAWQSGSCSCTALQPSGWVSCRVLARVPRGVR